MRNADDIAARLREHLLSEILATGSAERLDPDSDLVGLGIDSFSLLRLMLFIEQEFGVDMGGEDILGEGLSTIRQIAEHCAAREG